jgi:triosephosphate isomerase
MRKTIVAGNWKMNMDLEEAFFSQIIGFSISGIPHREKQRL